MRIWHYTVGASLRAILRDEQINPATASAGKGVRALVWCTTSPQWEPTANKSWMDRNGRVTRLDKEDTEAYGEGLYRIGILSDAVPYVWEDFKQLSGVTEGIAVALEQVARELGSNCSDWRMSFEPIARHQWLRIEFEVKGHQWVEIAWETAKAWTQSIWQKGCPCCAVTDKQTGHPWRYMPDPRTGEPRVMCGLCYERVESTLRPRRS